MDEKIFYCKPAVAGDILWTSALNSNQLLRLNLKTHEIVEMKTFQEVGTSFLYSEAIMSGGKIVFAPFNATRVAIYDIKHNQLSYIDTGRRPDEKSSLFYKVGSLYDYVFMFPCRSRSCIRIDIGCSAVNEYDFMDIDEVHDYSIHGRPYALKGGSVMGALIVLGMTQDNSLRIINTDDGTMNIIEIPFALNGISNIECLNNDIWVFGKNGRIVCYSMGDKEFKKNDQLFVSDYKDGINNHGTLFETMVNGGKIYISHSFVSKISVLDVITGGITTQEIGMNDYTEGRTMVVRYPAMFFYDSSICLLDGITGETYCLSRDDLALVDVFRAFSRDDVRYEEWPDTGIIEEMSGIRLKDLINYIQL